MLSLFQMEGASVPGAEQQKWTVSAMACSRCCAGGLVPSLAMRLTDLLCSSYAVPAGTLVQTIEKYLD